MTSSASPSTAERVQRSRLGAPIRAVVSRAKMPGWVKAGRPAPAPPHVKQAVVAEAVRRYRPEIFVETGTYRGDTLAKVAPLVGRAVSIELDPTLAQLARRRFRRMSHVEVREGDSAAVLPQVVAGLTSRALFWLDGHFSGGPTADSGTSPILAEIDTILSTAGDHVVLVDDIRLFDGTDGYPTIDQLRERVERLRPDLEFEVADDIARIHGSGRH